ncbi:DUF6461 domain-containing protein [Nonomuraea polychroma]|uniref:DUF6461 domain-containing protein n=1 Tax=Nonomuraea polychroma TaxID=46176 RepID=UPI003D8A6847
MDDGRPAWDELFSHYRQFLQDEPGLRVACCWTVVLPHDKTSVSDADVGMLVSGGTQHEVIRVTDPADYGYVDDHLMLIDRVDSALILFENNGFLGTMDSALRRLSRRGRACSVQWNVNAHNSFNYAVDGEVVVRIDAMFPDEWADKQHPFIKNELLQLATALAEDGADWRAGAMAAVELCTGVRISGEWFNRPLPCITFKWPIADEPISAKMKAEFDRDSELQLRIEASAASEPRQFTALSHLADQLSLRFQLREFPVTREVLADLRGGRYADDQRIVELREQFVMPLAGEFYDSLNEDEGDDIPMEENPAWLKMQASIALDIAARGPGSHPMGFDAYHHASLAFGNDWPPLREAIRKMLRMASD